MRKNILISFENLQELYDLTLLAKRLNYQHNVYLYDTSNLYKLSINNIDVYKKVFNSINDYEQDFNSLSKVKKIKTLIQNIINIKSIVKINKIDLLLTGVTLSLFRYTNMLNLGLNHIAYTRGIIANPKDYSLSSKIYGLLKIKLLSPLYCDRMAIVSPINIEYFYNYGLKDSDLIKCGPLHLDEIKSQIKIKATTKPAIIFATSAFAHHHLEELNDEQFTFLEELLNIYKNKYKENFDFLLRVHPRDDLSQYDDLKEKYKLKIDTRAIEDFLLDVSENKYLISAVSTLNFEWEYLDGKSIFYSAKNIHKIHQEFYDNLNITPIFKPLEIFSNIYNCIENDQKENFYHHDSNLNYFIKEIIL